MRNESKIIPASVGIKVQVGSLGRKPGPPWPEPSETGGRVSCEAPGEPPTWGEVTTGNKRGLSVSEAGGGHVVGSGVQGKALASHVGSSQ